MRAMTRVLPLLLVLTLLAPATAQRLSYPATHKGDVVEELHGRKIADPYRWLETLDAPETRSWIEEQNRLTFGWLETIPARSRINQRLTKLWDYERYGTPYREGARYFLSKNDGLQNHSVIYTLDRLDGEMRTLLNPNEWSADGTVSLGGLSVSHDGNLVAYAKSEGGSDWRTWYVHDIAAGRDLGDRLEWVKFSGASWTKDNKGFYYSRYDEPTGDKLEAVNKNQKLFYHRLGDPQSKDRLVYERPDEPDWGFGGSVTDDGRYLIISVWKGTERKNRVYYQDLSSGDETIHKLLDDFDAQYSFIDNDGPVFWFHTDLDAPRYRVIAIDTREPARANWKEIIPQVDDVLTGVGMVNNQFIGVYLHDAHTQVRMFDVAGRHVRDVKLPGIGSAGGFGGKRSDTETFYSFTSFTDPGTVYRYDMKSGESSIFRRQKVDFNPDDYETRQVFYRSKDGTRVPMFITHRKGIALDGANPTLLYGYGGFNISITPSFSVTSLAWMEMGGVYAVANLRGGGEYGKQWHDAGRLQSKQNVFDDFIAAAEWLIAEKYTQPAKLAIYGGSNGGLLVGACMTQRPELFGAAIPAVGVLDMLRFDQFTIGWAWKSDYGDPAEPEAFKTLLAYSPLHNLKPGTCYPATLILTGDHDDRVVPSHSFKYAAALQAAQGCESPALIRIETRAGHGAGKPTWMTIEEHADRLAFMVRVLGMERNGAQ